MTEVSFDWVTEKVFIIIFIRQVNDWLGELLWEGGKDFEIYRMKGVLNIDGSDTMHMLQVIF